MSTNAIRTLSDVGCRDRDQLLDLDRQRPRSEDALAEGRESIVNTRSKLPASGGDFGRGLRKNVLRHGAILLLSSLCRFTGSACLHGEASVRSRDALDKRTIFAPVIDFSDLTLHWTDAQWLLIIAQRLPERAVAGRLRKRFSRRLSIAARRCLLVTH